MDISNLKLPMPTEGLVVTQLVVAHDVPKTASFYAELLGGELVLDAEGFAMVKLANTWVIVVGGGEGTPDKPDVTTAPPQELHRFHSFMNIRVADITAVHEQWSKRGVEFITPPWDNHGGQATGVATE